MALVQRGFRLSVTLVDNGANTTAINYELRATTYANVTTAVTVILAELVKVTGGAIGQYTLSETYEEDALSLPTVGFQAEVSASLTTFISDAGLKKANYRIPMPVPAVFVSTIGEGANRVNTAEPDVLSYHGLFGPSGVANVSDGEIAGGLLGGVRVTRGKRGG